MSNTLGKKPLFFLSVFGHQPQKAAAVTPPTESWISGQMDRNTNLYKTWMVNGLHYSINTNYGNGDRTSISTIFQTTKSGYYPPAYGIRDLDTVNGLAVDGGATMLHHVGDNIWRFSTWSIIKGPDTALYGVSKYTDATVIGIPGNNYVMNVRAGVVSDTDGFMGMGAVFSVLWSAQQIGYVIIDNLISNNEYPITGVEPPAFPHPPYPQASPANQRPIPSGYISLPYSGIGPEPIVSEYCPGLATMMSVMTHYTTTASISVVVIDLHSTPPEPQLSLPPIPFGETVAVATMYQDGSNFWAMCYDGRIFKTASTESADPLTPGKPGIHNFKWVKVGEVGHVGWGYGIQCMFGDYSKGIYLAAVSTRGRGDLTDIYFSKNGIDWAYLSFIEGWGPFTSLYYDAEHKKIVAASANNNSTNALFSLDFLLDTEPVEGQAMFTDTLLKDMSYMRGVFSAVTNPTLYDAQWTNNPSGQTPRALSSKNITSWVGGANLILGGVATTRQFYSNLVQQSGIYYAFTSQDSTSRAYIGRMSLQLSTDGYDWIDISSRLPANTPTGWFISLGVMNNVLYLFRRGASINDYYKSTDGITWTFSSNLSTVAPRIDWMSFASDGNLRCLMSGVDTVTNQPYIATSLDNGTTWSITPILSLPGVMLSATTDHPSYHPLPSYPKVYFSDGTFVIHNIRAAGNGNGARPIFTSSDLITWNQRNISGSSLSNGTVVSIIKATGKWIAMVTNCCSVVPQTIWSKTQLFTSTDLNSWQPSKDLPYPYNGPDSTRFVNDKNQCYYDIRYLEGYNKFVALGSLVAQNWEWTLTPRRGMFSFFNRL